jgi:hypothetical protein
MTHGGALIVFELSVRICGALITSGCHMERVADFTTAAICNAAGRVMVLTPGVSGYKCKLETRNIPMHIGNSFNSGNPF